ncbi:hypothetical protein [Deinococcus sp. UYEF24]
MQITDTMDLHQLPEVIEKKFSRPQVDCLRKHLNETKYQSLEEVPAEVWMSLLELARIECPEP